MKKEQLFKAASLIAAASILSKILGFVRDTAMAKYYGATWAADAFLAASFVPSMLFTAVGLGLTTTVIPVFTRRLHDDGEEAAAGFINSLITLTLLICLALSVIGVLIAPFLVRVFAPGFRGETFTVTVYQTRLLLPTIVLMALSAIATGYLQARERFTWPALVGIPANILMIAILVLGAPRYGIMAAVIGTILVALCQFLVLWPGLREVRFRYRPLLNWQDPGLRQVGRKIVPVLFAGGVGQFGMAVDRMLASGLAAGSIAALNFGSKLTQFPLGIFVAAVYTVLFPTFSRYAADKDLGSLRSALASGIRVSIFLTLPVTVGLAVLREPIVRILFERGAFDPRATAMTATAVLFLSLGLIPMALQQVINRVYFSLQDTVTPMLWGMAGVAVNVVLDLLLVRSMQLGGLALATSIAALFSVVLLMDVLRRRLGGLGTRSMLDGAWRMGVASVAMGLSVWFAWQPVAGLSAGHGLVLAAACLAAVICVGAVVYGAAAYLLRLSEVEMFVNFAGRAGRKLLGRPQQEAD